MNRHRRHAAGAGRRLALVAGAAAEQAKPAAAAGRRAGSPTTKARRRSSSPPVRGEAAIGYTKPVVKAARSTASLIITTIKIKNLATGAIAGLKVDEFWYDKAGDPVTGRSVPASVSRSSRAK